MHVEAKGQRTTEEEKKRREERAEMLMTAMCCKSKQLSAAFLSDPTKFDKKNIRPSTMCSRFVPTSASIIEHLQINRIIELPCGRKNISLN